MKSVKEEDADDLTSENANADPVELDWTDWRCGVTEPTVKAESSNKKPNEVSLQLADAERFMADNL